jgi:hypothetical protein
MSKPSVIIDLISTAPGSDDSNRSRLILNEIWVSRGGGWTATAMAYPYSGGPWRASPQDPSDILGIGGENADTRVWIIMATTSPLTVGQTNKGKMEIASGRMPYGSFTWKIVAVGSLDMDSAALDPVSSAAASDDAGPSGTSPDDSSAS